MLEQSAAELRATVEELENRYDTIDNEGTLIMSQCTVYSKLKYSPTIL
jgi:hypothetical protein